MSTDLAGSGLAYGSPSVALARTTATTERPSSAAPSPPAFVQLPFSMCQASTASWPARFTSEFAKHGPVYTSALRASMYFPVICAALPVVAPAASAGSRKTRRETRTTFRNFIAVPPQEDRRYSPTPPRAFQDFPFLGAAQVEPAASDGAAILELLHLAGLSDSVQAWNVLYQPTI